MSCKDKYSKLVNNPTAEGIVPMKHIYNKYNLLKLAQIEQTTYYQTYSLQHTNTNFYNTNFTNYINNIQNKYHISYYYSNKSSPN